MKKISIIFFLTLYSFMGQSQTSYFGFEAGVNVANQRSIYNSVASGGIIQTSLFQNVIRPAFSIYYHFQLADKVGARVKASYTGFGFKDDYLMLFYPRLKEIDINYLMVPITFFYNANQHLSLTGGPYISFTVGGSHPYNHDITSTYHKNDYGVSFGGEHDIYKGLALSITYYIGLKNIWLDDRNGTIDYTNRALQIALIYKFKKQTEKL